MNQRALDQMLHRIGMDRPVLFYLWAIPLTLGAVFLTWLTFRDGIGPLLHDPGPFVIWVIAMIALGTLWRVRPRK